MFFWVTSIIRWIRMTFQAVRNVRNRWAPELKQLTPPAVEKRICEH